MTKIQILGTGCPSCHKLHANAQAAAQEMGLACTIEKVTDILQILEFNALGLPALAIDGRVQAAGRVLSTEEIKAHLAGTRGGTV